VFARNMANQWTKSLETVIPLDIWQQCAYPELEKPEHYALAFDVAYDRSESAIVAAWRNNAGIAQFKIIHSAPGVSWLTGAIKNLIKNTGAIIGADNAGATKSIIDDLETEQITIETLGAADFATATGDFLALFTPDENNHLPLHDGEPGWETDIAGASKRRLGQSFAWDRAGSAAPIPRLIAATVALRLFDHGKPQIPAPYIWEPK
jgi:hypothetical protein